MHHCKYENMLLLLLSPKLKENSHGCFAEVLFRTKSCQMEALAIYDPNNSQIPHCFVHCELNLLSNKESSKTP